MLRFKIWIILPVLVVLPALAGFHLFTEVLVHQATEGVERELDHTRSWLGAAMNAISERELRVSAQKAHALAETGLLAARGAPEAAGGGRKKAKDEPSPAETAAAIRAWLQEHQSAGETGLSAVFGPDGGLLASHPEGAEYDPAACLGSKALAGALKGAAGAGFVRAGESVYVAAASPLRLGGVVAAALCSARRVHDSAAFELGRALGYEASLFDGQRILGSTLRQSNPDVLADLSAKSGFVLLGRLQSGDTPMFAAVPLFASIVAPVTTDAGQLKVGVTARFDGAVAGFRSLQGFYLLGMLSVLLVTLVVAWSIHRTLVRTVGVIAAGLAAVAKGNLQAQVPVASVEPPLNGIAEAINRTLYAVRERGQFFAAKKKAEIGGMLAPAAPSSATPTDPYVSEPASARPPSGEAILDSGPDRQSESPEPGRASPLSGEIQVGEEISETDSLDGGDSEQITSSDYNPDATVVAMMPAEYMEQVDKEIEAMRAAKDAARSDPFVAVYHEFLQTRLKCGEKVENLSQDRFVEKLKKTRDDVTSKSGCKDVRFSVVVKDGKASIKASPIK